MFTGIEMDKLSVDIDTNNQALRFCVLFIFSWGLLHFCCPNYCMFSCSPKAGENYQNRPRVQMFLSQIGIKPNG